MIASFDATMLILLFDRDAAAPTDEATGKPVDHCQERLVYLLQTLSKEKGSRLIFPVPALAEFFVRVEPEKAAEYASNVQRLRGSVVAPFDMRAAIESAEMQKAVIAEKGRRVRKGVVESHAKAKFDQQIVAIAKANGAAVIYTDDRGLGNYAKRFDIEPIGVATLPVSPDTRQGVLPFDAPEAAPEGSDTEVEDPRDDG